MSGEALLPGNSVTHPYAPDHSLLPGSIIFTGRCARVTRHSYKRRCQDGSHGPCLASLHSCKADADPLDDIYNISTLYMCRNPLLSMGTEATCKSETQLQSQKAMRRWFWLLAFLAAACLVEVVAYISTEWQANRAGALYVPPSAKPSWRSLHRIGHELLSKHSHRYVPILAVVIICALVN